MNRNRIKEIEARLAAIAAQIEARAEGDAEAAEPAEEEAAITYTLTAEQLTAMEAEVDALKAELAKLRDTEQQRSALLASVAEYRNGGSVLRSFPSPAPATEARSAEADAFGTMEYRRAFMAHVLRGAQIPAEYRANANTKTADIGVMIPSTVLDQIVERLENAGMILPLVTHTAYKGGVSIPTSSVKPVATWVSEGAGSDRQKKTTGSVTFAYHKLRCAVSVSLEVDTMALAAFEASLMNNIVEAMTIAIEQAIISGDGKNKIRGILAETPNDGQALTTAAPCYDDLIKAEAALPKAYESGAVWVMTKKTFMAFYGMTDSVGEPIARVTSGITSAPERVLLGRKVVECDYLPSYGDAMPTGEVFAFLFNFKDYILNTNYAMGVKRYEDNDTDDIVTRAVMLVDGKVVEKSSLVTLAKAAKG